MTPAVVIDETIILQEYADTAVVLEDADLLYIQLKLAKQLTLSRPLFDGGYLLNPNQFAGVVVLPSGRRIECRPKVPVRNFFVMLAIAFDLEPSFLQETTSFQEIDQIFEFVISYFADLVDHQIQRGLYRTYVEREENLAAVRGRIAIAEDVRQNSVLRQRTYCHFTEFTWDNPDNQIVRQVAHMVGGWAQSSGLRFRLHQIDRRMAEVSPVTHSASVIDRFSYHRLNAEYRPIHQMCRLFLEGSTLSEDRGRFDFRTFIFDMNSLFESFVSKLLARHAPPNLAIDLQSYNRLDVEKLVVIRPDVLVYKNGAVHRVIDCKYKRLKESESKNHDLYQLHAYCTALDCLEGLLIYPRHLDLVDFTYHIRNTNIAIRQVSIDLNVKPAAFEDACARFASSLISD